jgi:hypothetical protein
MTAWRTRKKPGTGTDRDKIWMSIRILRRFSIPDVIRTSGAGGENVRVYMRFLRIHGYIARDGAWTRGRAGEYRAYRLVKDLPQRPEKCERCGRWVTEAVCAEAMP